VSPTLRESGETVKRTVGVVLVRPSARLSRPADTRHSSAQLAALTEPYRAKALCASLGASQTLTDREMHRRSRVRLGERLDALTRVSRRVARSHSADMRKGAPLGTPSLLG